LVNQCVFHQHTTPIIYSRSQVTSYNIYQFISVCCFASVQHLQQQGDQQQQEQQQVGLPNHLSGLTNAVLL
jgi:hypothetical protein